MIQSWTGLAESTNAMTALGLAQSILDRLPDSSTVCLSEINSASQRLVNMLRDFPDLESPDELSELSPNPKLPLLPSLYFH